MSVFVDMSKAPCGYADKLSLLVRASGRRTAIITDTGAMGVCVKVFSQPGCDDVVIWAGRGTCRFPRNLSWSGDMTPEAMAEAVEWYAGA